MLETPTADGLWPYVKDAPSFRAMCRILHSLGVLGLPAKLKRPIARDLCGRLGFEPSDNSFLDQIKPSNFTADALSKGRISGQIRSKENKYHQRPLHRLKTMQASIRRRNIKLYGVDHPPGGILDDYLVAIWDDAIRPDHSWAGVIDPAAFGALTTSGSSGHPFALSIDRINCGFGYVLGNCQAVPNAWNKTICHWGDARIAQLAHQAVSGRHGKPVAATPRTQVQRPRTRTSLQALFLGPSSPLFLKHPNLLAYRAEMLKKFEDDLTRVTCAVTGLPFVYELNHPCWPSYDLVDPNKAAKGNYAAFGNSRGGLKITFSGGRETPADMRLVCRFVNHGMSTWGEGPWWVVARRAAELHEAGYFTSRDS